MKIYIKTVTQWFDHRPKLKQWAWFLGLWMFGLLTVVIGTYPIKLIIKNMG